MGTGAGLGIETEVEGAGAVATVGAVGMCAIGIKAGFLPLTLPFLVGIEAGVEEAGAVGAVGAVGVCAVGIGTGFLPLPFWVGIGAGMVGAVGPYCFIPSPRRRLLPATAASSG